MGRKKGNKDAEAVAERAAEIRDQARVLADEGGDAVKDFAATTSSAAKDFASTTFEAAKDLLETVEKAGERLNKESKRNKKKKRRGRKVLKTGLAVGAGVFVFTNETTRNFISQAVQKVRGGGEPEPWDAAGDGDFSAQTTPAPETTP